MKVKVISGVQVMLYTKRNLPIYKGEFELELGAQDLENYKKEIAEKKLDIKFEIIPEEDGANGDKNKGKNKKSTTEGNGSQ